MVSDILSDAVTEIKEYLDTEFYIDMPKNIEENIYKALEAMEVARISLDKGDIKND